MRPDMRRGTRHAPRKQWIIDLVKERGEISCKDLQKEMGITRNNAAQVLWHMYRENMLNRTGERGRYRYTA